MSLWLSHRVWEGEWSDAEGEDRSQPRQGLVRAQTLRVVETTGKFKQGLTHSGVYFLKVTLTLVWRTNQKEARLDVGRTDKKIYSSLVGIMDSRALPEMKLCARCVNL